MKTLKLITAGLLASAVVSVASASTTIRITGSTAFRKGACDAIEKILNPGYVCGASNATLNKANQQVFVGTTVGDNNPVIIECSWSGSAGGVESLAQNLPAGQPFLDEPVVTNFTSNPAVATVDGTSLTTGGVTLTVNSNSELADCAFSDAFMESTPFGAAGVTPAFPSGAIPNVALTSTAIGIVPFEWVAGEYQVNGGATVATPYTGVANMTLNNAQALLGGTVGLSLLTGSTSAADQNTTVYCVGRDHDSGTRIGAEYDSQLNQDIFFATDTGYSETVAQYIPNGASQTGTQFGAQTAGSGVITSVSPWPSEAVLGETRSTGQEGFFSGSNVAAVLTRPSAIKTAGAGSLYVISYLGMSDAASVDADTTYTYQDGATNIDTITPSKNALLFNGVYPGSSTHHFGPPYTNVEQGSYTFWGVEHFLYPTALSGTKLTVANQLSTQITTEADFAGVGDLLSNMTVGISGDGQANIPGFPFGE
jgi:hypothetical protein